jgi:hypothetical protein
VTTRIEERWEGVSAAVNKYIPVSNKLLMRLIDSMPADALKAFGPLQTTECVTRFLQSMSLIRKT